MLNKFWWQELKRKWSRLEPGPPHARIFSEPGWQSHVALWYLLYRWLMFGAWITIIICSIFEIGSYKPEGNNHKWPIYLTNWDLVLGVSQAFLGALLVSRRWKSQFQSDFDPSYSTFGMMEKTYWFLFTVTSTMAIGVTTVYWCAVYDPEIHHRDPLNFMLHLVNSILMVIDCAIVAIPFKLRYFWWCTTVVTFYLIFSAIYYFAGGLDKHGRPYIYKVLNWKNLGRTLLVCLGGLIFLTVLHCILCVLARLRNRLHGKSSDGEVKRSNILRTNPPLVTKRVDLVV